MGQRFSVSNYAVTAEEFRHKELWVLAYQTAPTGRWNLAAAFTLGDLAEKSYAEFGAPFGPETGFTVKLLAPKSTQHPAPQQPRPLHPRGPSVKQLPLAEDFNRLRSPDKYVLVYRPVGGGDWWERGPEFDTLSLGRFSLLVMLDGVHRMLLHPQGSSEPDDVRSDPANLR